MKRVLWLFGLVAAGLLLIGWPRPAPREADAGARRLTWIATAHQLGPVGYRDPVGAISPDGQWMAYTEGRFLRVRPVDGGPSPHLEPGDGQIRHLAWHPDSRRLLADGDAAHGGWSVYDIHTGARVPLLPPNLSPQPTAPLRQPAWSPDGTSVAAIVAARDGQELWVIPAGGESPTVRQVAGRVSYPAWTPAGDVACVAAREGLQRVTIPCGGSEIKTEPDGDVYGPIAFSPDGSTVYGAMPNEDGTVDLHAIPAAGGRTRRLTSFSRDSYAPSVAAGGEVVFKVQSYRTVVAHAPADGGATALLATFRSETPSWDPTGSLIGITFGTWRRVIDDANYPDIAQEAGVIRIGGAPATSVEQVVDDSVSEDQSLCWSPNGKWIAYHSHKEQSDDIWLRPADGSADGRRISFLGRGAETGWPRWSPDGRWLLFDGASRTGGRGALYVVGVDQESGAVTREPAEVPIEALNGEVSHGEWLGNSEAIVAVGKEAAGRHVIFTVPRDGGRARVVHRFASEHDTAGLGVSPDGRHVAFIAPADDGFFQLFRLPVAGGVPVQVTRDPSHKTQPAWSPDGRTIAFTVWSYEAQFWTIGGLQPSGVGLRD